MASQELSHVTSSGSHRHYNHRALERPEWSILASMLTCIPSSPIPLAPDFMCPLKQLLLRFSRIFLSLNRINIFQISGDKTIVFYWHRQCLPFTQDIFLPGRLPHICCIMPLALCQLFVAGRVTCEYLDIKQWSTSKFTLGFSLFLFYTFFHIHSLNYYLKTNDFFWALSQYIRFPVRHLS